MENKEIPRFNTSFDASILLKIFKKNIFVIIIIFTLLIIAAFLYLRYTTPLYQAKTVIQLDVEDKMQSELFMADMQSSSNNQISERVELLRSKTFLTEALDTLPLEIGYFSEGRVTETELYKNACFIIENYQYNVQELLNVPIYIHYDKSTKQVSIEYTLHSGTKIEKDIEIAETYKSDMLSFDITVDDENAFINQIQNSSNTVYFCFRNKDQVIAEYINAIVIEVVNPSAKTIQITSETDNAIEAADIVNTISNFFLIYDLEKKTEGTNQIIAFIDQRLKELADTLYDQREKIDIFKRENNIENSNGDDLLAPGLIERLGDLERQLFQMELEVEIIKRIEIELANNDQFDIISLVSLTAGTSIESSISYMMDVLQEQLLQRETLLFEYTEESGQVQKLDYQIEIQKKIIIENISGIRASFDNSILDINKKIIEYESNFYVDSANYDVLELSKLQKTYIINEQYYNSFLDRKANYLINRAGVVSQSEILDAAVPNSTPIAPIGQSIYIIFIVIGIFVSLIILAIKYLLFNSIVSEKDVQKYTNASFIGMVPTYKDTVENSTSIVDDNPKSIIAEAFRKIRTNMQFIEKFDSPRVIAITSTVPKEGKTFVILNLASIIAFSDKKVIVIDLDLRKPRIHHGFGVPNNDGMSNVLSGRSTIDEVIHKTNSKVDFITAGAIPPNPSELIMGESMLKVIEELKSRYDFILIDNSPVGLVSDAITSLEIADFPIYVFRSNVSKKTYINEFLALRENPSLSSLSFVINDYKLTKSLHYGSYGDYSYGYISDKK